MLHKESIQVILISKYTLNMVALNRVSKCCFLIEMIKEPLVYMYHYCSEKDPEVVLFLPAAPTKSLHSPKVTSGSFSPRRKSFRQPHTTWMSSMWDYNVKMLHASILHSDKNSLFHITRRAWCREILWNIWYNLLKHVIIQFWSCLMSKWYLFEIASCFSIPLLKRLCITKQILKLKSLTKFGTPFPFMNSFFNSLTCESALEKEKNIRWRLMNLFFEKW